MIKHRFKTAFILGAGRGTRLRPLTEYVPKPLLPVLGRPMITYAMDHLMTVGIERFIINTHHRPEKYLETFPDRTWRGIPIELRYEPVLLDTGGGLKNIHDLLVHDEAIICYNGDILTDMPLDILIREHNAHPCEATLALRTQGPNLNVDIEKTGTLCDIRYTLNIPGEKSCLFTGIYAVEVSLLDGIGQAVTESIIDIFLSRIIARPSSIRGIIIDSGRWDDIGSVKVYEGLQQQISSNNRRRLPK